MLEDAKDLVVIEHRLNNALDKLFGVVGVTSKCLRKTNFVLVEPMAIPAVKWYSEVVEILATEESQQSE